MGVPAGLCDHLRVQVGVQAETRWPRRERIEESRLPGWDVVLGYLHHLFLFLGLGVSKTLRKRLGQMKCFYWN